MCDWDRKDEVIDMAGKHGVPSTGDGRKGGKKVTKAQAAVTNSRGTILWKATAAIFGSKTKKPKGK